ncbi:MAG: hypothetical protein LKKZDAJK_001628 [Candidatus Fervidibacter sp.]
MQWIRVGWVVLSLASLSFTQWQKTLKELCRSLSLPSFSPLHSVQLKNPSDFSPVALVVLDKHRRFLTHLPWKLPT